MQLSTDFKLYAACIACLTLLAAIGIASYTTTGQLLNTLDVVADAHQMRADLEVMATNLQHAETAGAEFGLTGKDTFKKSYEDSAQKAAQNLLELRTLTANDSSLRSSVDHLTLLVSKQVDSLDRTAAAVKSNPAQVATHTEATRQLGKNIQEVMNQLAADERNRLIARSESAAAYSYFGRLVVAGSTIACFLFVIASTIFIRRDIQQRTKSEAALRAAERKIRGIFENAPVGIFESAPDGKWLTANGTMAAILGYDSPEELLKEHNEKKKPLYVDPEARLSLISRLSETGVIHDCETQWYRKDGSTVWVTGMGRVVDDGDGNLHFEAMLHDITERKLAEKQLAHVKSQLENVLNSATGVSIISTDVQGRITIFNPGAERMLGYSAKEMVAKSTDVFHYEAELTERCRELSAKVGRRIGRFDVIVENVRKGGYDVREWTYVCKDGRHLAVSVTVTGIRDAQGELIGFLGIGTDITDRRLAERDRARLEQQLRRKNLELERETQRALEASRMKSEFLANMSHELRTPLNGIIGFAEMMHDEVIGPISDEHKDYLSDILTSARHLLQLINDVLDLSKVEAGKMEFQPEDIDSDVLIGEVHAILQSLSSKKKLQMDTELDPEVGRIHLDPRKLKQVLYNYLSNAIKFTPESGRICVRTRRETDDMFRVEVQDSGIGIKPEDLNHLFVEFLQLDASASKRYQGTGLGLALTKRIVEAQGGKVGVESSWGKGSTFYAVLPLSGSPILIPNPAALVSKEGTALELSSAGRA